MNLQGSVAGELAPRDKLLLLILRLVSALPLDILQKLGIAIGWMVAQLPNAKPSFIVKRNLELCFPEKSPAWIATTTRANLMATAPSVLEFAKTWGMRPDYSIQQIRAVHGADVFFEAINGGRGTIAIIPHFGSWEFMNAWVNQHTRTTIMYKPARNAGLDAFALQARSRLQAQLVPANDSGVKALLKALRKGAFSAVLPDHVPQDNGGIYAPFFGISTWSGVIVPRLIQRTGCAVIVLSCIRRPDGDGFDMYVDRPHPDIFSDDLLTAVTAMNQSTEAVIRRAPAQYHWLYKRFRKNESLPNPYQRKTPPATTNADAGRWLPTT
jgi:KDO2-lipid IV(A) lauroyltransferase